MILINKAPWVITGLFATALFGMELPDIKPSIFEHSSLSTKLWCRDASTGVFIPSESLMAHTDCFGIREYTGKAPVHVLVSSGSASLFSPKKQQHYMLGAIGVCALDQLTGRCAYTDADSSSKMISICDTKHCNTITFEHAVLGLAWARKSLIVLLENALVRMDLDETGEPISRSTHTIKPIQPTSFSSLRRGFFGGISAENTHIHIFRYDAASLVDFVVNLPKGCEDGHLRAHAFEGSFLFSVCGKKKIVFFSAPVFGKRRAVPKVELALNALAGETFVDCAIKADEEYLFATFTKDTDARAGVRCWKLADRVKSCAYWYLPNSTVTHIFQDDSGLIFSDKQSMSITFLVEQAEDQPTKKSKHEN